MKLKSGYKTLQQVKLIIHREPALWNKLSDLGSNKRLYELSSCQALFFYRMIFF